MNKIIRHVPIGEIPEKWREGLPQNGTVEIELRVAPDRPKVRSANLVGSGPNVHGSLPEILDHIGALRADRDEGK